MIESLQAFLSKFRERWQSMKEGNNPNPIILSHDSESLTLEGLTKEKKKESIQITWNEVFGAHAYKLDSTQLIASVLSWS